MVKSVEDAEHYVEACRVPSVKIEFTRDELSALRNAILGAGELNGAWHKLRVAFKLVGLPS